MSDKLEQVKATIPHREPFLFVDEILERAEGRIVTQRLVRGASHSFMTGQSNCGSPGGDAATTLKL